MPDTPQMESRLDGSQNRLARVFGAVCRDEVTVLTDASPITLLLGRLSQVAGEGPHKVQARDSRGIWITPGRSPDESASEENPGQGRLVGEGHMHFLRRAVHVAERDHRAAADPFGVEGS